MNKQGNSYQENKASEENLDSPQVRERYNYEEVERTPQEVTSNNQNNVNGNSLNNQPVLDEEQRIMNKEVINDSVRTPQTEYNQSLNMTRGNNYNYDDYRTSQSDYLSNSSNNLERSESNFMRNDNLERSSDNFSRYNNSSLESNINKERFNNQFDYSGNGDLSNSQVDISNRQVNNSSEQINHRTEQRNSIRNEVNNSVRTSQAEFSKKLSREATEIKKQDS